MKTIKDLPAYEKEELNYLSESYAQIIDSLYRFAENNGMCSDDVFQYANEIYDKKKG